MTTLSEIRGQPRVVELLRRAIAQDRVPHAYLFCGPKGCGKHTTGIALAAALNCQSRPGEGCGTCDACEKIFGGRHPDVRTLERQGAARIIPIETIRTEVVPVLAMPPHEGKARLFLIEETAALQPASANALLKTLEEPPPRTHFVLGTTAPDQLLPTIRSRCQRVAFAALSPAVAAELHGDSEGAARLREHADAMMRAIDTADRGAVFEVAAGVAEDRADAAAALVALADRLHDAARKAAANLDLRLAGRFSRRASLVLEAEMAMTLHNAHAQLTVEDLLFRLRSV